jgi:hypothetical protein
MAARVREPRGEGQEVRVHVQDRDHLRFLLRQRLNNRLNGKLWTRRSRKIATLNVAKMQRKKYALPIIISGMLKQRLVKFGIPHPSIS